MELKLRLREWLGVKSRPDLSSVLKGMLTSLLVAMSLAAAAAGGIVRVNRLEPTGEVS